MTTPKKYKPPRTHPWRVQGPPPKTQHTSQRESENKVVPHHANPLRRKFS